MQSFLPSTSTCWVSRSPCNMWNGKQFHEVIGRKLCCLSSQNAAQCFICKVQSTSSVLLHLNDLFLDPPLELAQKLAQLGAGVHGDVIAASFLVSQCISCHDSALCLCKKWSQVDDRTVFLIRFWCFSGAWNLLHPKAKAMNLMMISKNSVSDIGNTQQPPKAYVIAPPLLAPEDQRRPKGPAMRHSPCENLENARLVCSSLYLPACQFRHHPSNQQIWKSQL